jgi:hypothetical protein
MDKARALLRNSIPFEEPLLSILKRYAWSVPVMAALGFVSTGLEGLGIGLLIPLLTSLLTDGGLTSQTAFLAPVNEILTQLDPRLRQWAISGAMLFLMAFRRSTPHSSRGCMVRLAMTFAARFRVNY